MKTIKQEVYINAKPDLALAGFIGDFVGDVHEKNDNQDQSGRYLGIGNYRVKISHFYRYFSISTAINKKIIPIIIFLINNNTASKIAKSVKFGVTIATPNHTPEIFIDKAESALSQYLGIFSTTTTVAMGQNGVNFMEKINENN